MFPAVKMQEKPNESAGLPFSGGEHITVCDMFVMP
jgi:hypothetical protein